MEVSLFSVGGATNLNFISVDVEFVEFGMSKKIFNMGLSGPLLFLLIFHFLGTRLDYN